MEFRFTAEEEAFRTEVRSFIHEEFPKARSGESFTKKLAAKGWLTMSWPKEHGGQAASHMRQLVYNEEMAYNRAPGQTMLGWMSEAKSTINAGLSGKVDCALLIHPTQ